MVNKAGDSKSLSSGKMIPERDLLAVKEQVKKLKEEIAKERTTRAELEAKLMVADITDVDDEDVKAVREYLVEKETELAQREAALRQRDEEMGEKETTFKERERDSRVQALASQYKLDAKQIEDLTTADDPEKRALELVVERLTSQKGEEMPKEEKPSAEEIFEGTPAGGKVKKSPLDMNSKEFAVYEAQLKKEALAKR